MRATMSTDTNKPSIKARKRAWIRAFRPFFAWLPIGGLLVAADAHLRLLEKTSVFFRVSVEGHAIQTGYTASLDSLPVSPGRRVGLGWHTLHLAVEDAEPIEQRCFIWYGRNDLGEFKLAAHKGALEIVLDPTPIDIQVTGRRFSEKVHESPAFFSALTVGEYTVAARYKWLQEKQVVRVQHGNTNRLVIQPDLGSLDVSVEPPDAQFRLASLNRTDVVLNDRVPGHVRHVPSGEYRLRVWRGDYLKESKVEIKRGQTNQVSVVFEYGQVQVVSDPVGATVYHGEQAIGQTPKVFSELKPGRYQFRLEQAGYEPAQISFEVRGAEPLTIRTNLVNIRFKTAMQKARRLASASRPDYQETLASLAEALEAQPGDPEAAEFKARVEAEFASHQARLAEAQRNAELAQRRQSGANLFKLETDKLKHAALFDAQMRTVHTNLATVCEALRRTFEKGPQHRWTVEKETAEEDARVIFQCKGNSSLQSKRFCVVMAYQISPQEVQVHAKFWDYLFSGVISLVLSGGSDDSKWIPMHPRHVSQDQVQNVEERRRQLSQGFWEILKKELRSEYAR